MELSPYRFPGGSSLPHYYGDIVRMFLIASAAAMILAHPLYANHIRIELPFTLVGALILVILAGLTNPRTKSILVADCVAAGVGMVIYEAWALYQYDTDTLLAFAVRQTIAVLFMVALYFSLKTLRAMLQHNIGKRGQVGEFDDEAGLADETQFPSGKIPEGDYPEEVQPFRQQQYTPEAINHYLKRTNRQRGGGEDEETQRARAEEAAQRGKDDDDIATGRL